MPETLENMHRSLLVFGRAVLSRRARAVIIQIIEKGLLENTTSTSGSLLNDVLLKLEPDENELVGKSLSPA